MDKLNAYFEFDCAFASFTNPYFNKKHIHTFATRLDGNQEAPIPVDTKAMGYGKFIYNSKNRELLYYVDYKGLSTNETASHFHVGGSKEPGPIEIGVPVGNPKIGLVILTEEQEELLFTGKLFFNIHSSNFPAGEIRGQIFPTSHADNDEYLSQIVARKHLKKDMKKKNNKKKTIYGDKKSKIDSAMIEKAIKNWKDVFVGNKFMGLSAKILDIREEGGTRFITLEIENKDSKFPMHIPMDIHTNGDGKVTSITLLNNRMPMEAIPDIIKFLKSLV